MNKIKVSPEEFEKKVEIEAAHLIHLYKMSKAKADKEALEDVSQRFEVE